MAELDLVTRCALCGAEGMTMDGNAVPRDVLDSLANAYWVLRNGNVYDICVRRGREFGVEQFERLIDDDPLWRDVCEALRPGLEAGLRTSAVVVDSITRMRLSPRQEPQHGDDAGGDAEGGKP